MRDTILKLYTELTDDDIRVPVGSETGADLKLNKKATEILPFKFEMKNRETFKTLYAFYTQAQGHKGADLEPLLIIKMNHKKPLIIMDAEYFLKLWKEFKTNG